MSLAPRWANALIVAGLAAFMALVSLTAPRWSRSLREPLPPPDLPVQGDSTPGSTGTEGEEGSEAERRINVKLFFEAPDRGGLAMEERSVAFEGELSRQVRVVVEELIRGSQQGLLPTLDPATRVLDVFVTARGVGYVDLSGEVLETVSGGSDAERVTVYSVVNSVTTNFPAIKRVQIVVDDRMRATLGGHMDLTRPLPPDMTLLAAARESPATSESPPAARESPATSESPPAARESPATPESPPAVPESPAPSPPPSPGAQPKPGEPPQS